MLHKAGIFCRARNTRKLALTMKPFTRLWSSQKLSLGLFFGISAFIHAVGLYLFDSMDLPLQSLNLSPTVIYLISNGIFEGAIPNTCQHGCPFFQDSLKITNVPSNQNTHTRICLLHAKDPFYKTETFITTQSFRRVSYLSYSCRSVHY